MGIFKRLEDIVSANLNDLLDRNQNPEPMLKQAIQEMESAISEATTATAKAMAQEKRVRNQWAESSLETDLWQQRAEKAVAANDSDAARQALQRRRELDKIVAALNDQMEANSEAATVLRHQLEGMKVRLAEAKRMIGVVAARQRAATSRQQEFGGSFRTDAFDRFDELSERVDLAEAEADAIEELLGKPKRAARDPEPASANNEVEEELMALKSRKR